jgi:DNA-binding SARP family transcriptional activator
MVRIAFGDGEEAPERPEPTPAPAIDEVAPPEAREPHAPATSRRVRVSVLGTLSVSVDGRLVPPNELAKRRARDLIAVLAVKPSHKMSKLELIEAIWGDCDYVSGLQKLYEATTCARRILRGGEAEANPIISSRYSGSIALNANEIAFDTDEFRCLAMFALMSEGGDRNTMRYATEADRMYAGGIGHELPDVSGVFAAERDVLAKAHVDSNIAGSIASLREGKAYLAVDLARSALQEDGLREDAIKCLASALATQGRRAEIMTAYKDYRWRLRKELGVRPSSDVHRHVENALRDAEIGDGGAEPKDGRLNARPNMDADDGWRTTGGGMVGHGDGGADALKS